MPHNIFYAQSGGPTAVINVSASAVIETAAQHPDVFGKVLAGRNGILGALYEELIDTSQEDPALIQALQHTPACAFGSCRYKLKDMQIDDSEYRRLIDVFAAHDIKTFIYNGGNDSQDTTFKISQMSRQLNYPLTCIGIPKTIDNDLPFTDNCPGFGSAAKYIAISMREAALDLASMAASSTKIFILEVMGRHAGWMAAAAGLAQTTTDSAPHIILFPEVAFDHEKFLARVQATVARHGYCVIAVSEGVRTADGKLLHETNLHDAFGHEQLGGVAPIIARLIKHRHGFKYHYAIADYLQRSARHIASKTDFDHAYALGKAAVDYAKQGVSDVMITIERLPDAIYQWKVGHVPLAKVANVENKLPLEFISQDGYAITQACRDYLLPLIQGEAYPPYKDGMPDYIQLKNHLVAKKLVVPNMT